MEGSLIRLVVDRLPGDRNPKPMWLWTSATGLDATAVDRLWQAYLRRFDVEHTFRLFKQTLGWTKRGSATRRQPTAGHGYSSPRTPNYPSAPTCTLTYA